MVKPKGNICEKPFEIIDNQSKQYILLLLNALNGKAVENKINLMHMLFVISLNVKSLKSEFNFESGYWGPESEVVELNLETLLTENFIKKDKEGYSLDLLGINYLSICEFSDVDLELICDMKRLFSGLTPDEACAFTYFTFPESTCKSAILDGIVKNRLNLALSLYNKDKFSAG